MDRYPYVLSKYADGKHLFIFYLFFAVYTLFTIFENLLWNAWLITEGRLDFFLFDEKNKSFDAM